MRDFLTGVPLLYGIHFLATATGFWTRAAGAVLVLYSLDHRFEGRK